MTTWGTKEQRREWMRNYWKTHPDKYEEHKRKMRERNRSVEGYKKDREYHKKFKKSNPSYYSEYMKQWRENKKMCGVCIRCGKRKAMDGYFYCIKCMELTDQMNINRQFKMQKNVEILHLTLIKKWFDLIAEGKKHTEYRKITEYWTKRLMMGFSYRKYKEVWFRNGYRKDSPFMRVEFIKTEKEDFEGELHYAIRLGKILEIKNWREK